MRKMQETGARGSREARVIRVLVWSLVGLSVAALLLYPADWAVWRVRMLFGGGMATVRVSRFTVEELKGNKEEYDLDEVDTVACSRSLFEQAGEGACWQLRRHPEVYTRY